MIWLTVTHNGNNTPLQTSTAEPEHKEKKGKEQKKRRYKPPSPPPPLTCSPQASRPPPLTGLATPQPDLITECNNMILWHNGSAAIITTLGMPASLLLTLPVRWVCDLAYECQNTLPRDYIERGWVDTQQVHGMVTFLTLFPVRFLITMRTIDKGSVCLREYSIKTCCSLLPIKGSP